MSTDYHTPIATGAAANAATFNAPLGQLDAAISTGAGLAATGATTGATTQAQEFVKQTIAARFLPSGDLYDDFQRANQSGLGDAVTGQTWTITGTGAANCGIVNNGFEVDSGYTVYAYIPWTATAFRISAKVSILAGTGTDDAVFTLAGSGGPGLIDKLVHFNTYSDGWDFQLYSAGIGWVSIGAGSYTTMATDGTVYDIAMTVVGNTVFLRLADGTYRDYTDSRISGLLGAFVFCEMARTASSYKHRFEEISVVDLTRVGGAFQNIQQDLSAATGNPSFPNLSLGSHLNVAQTLTFSGYPAAISKIAFETSDSSVRGYLRCVPASDGAVAKDVLALGNTTHNDLLTIYNGNVGIGTTLPTAKFQVDVGTDQLFKVGSLGTELFLAAYNTASNAFVPMQFFASEFDFTGVIGAGTNAPGAQLHADQSSTTGAMPVLLLDQADVSEPFIKLIGESTTDNSQSLVDAADLEDAGAIVGWFKVYVEDVASSGAITDGTYYIPIYSTPTHSA